MVSNLPGVEANACRLAGQVNPTLMGAFAAHSILAVETTISALHDSFHTPMRSRRSHKLLLMKRGVQIREPGSEPGSNNIRYCDY